MLRRVWPLVALVIGTCPILAQDDAADPVVETEAETADVPGTPPAYPEAERMLSATVRSWHIGLVQFLFVDDVRLRRVVDYLADLPGAPPKLRVYKGPKVPETAPKLVQEFYNDWARNAGYRLVVDVRLGVEPDGARGTPPKTTLSATPPANDTWPPVPLHTKRPFSDKAPWELEDYAWVSVYYRPGEDGGAFVSVWVSGTHVWVFKPGHIAIGPVLAEFLDLPNVPHDEAPPATVPPEPPASPLPGMPVVGDTGFFVRAELGKWEIDSLVRDVGAGAKRSSLVSPLVAMLAAGPELFAPVRHAWVFTFRGHPDYREDCMAPWAQWMADADWRELMHGTYGGVPIRIWYGAGPEGGAVAMFDVEQSSSVLICEGAPNLFALLPVLGTLQAGP